MPRDYKVYLEDMLVALQGFTNALLTSANEHSTL